MSVVLQCFLYYSTTFLLNKHISVPATCEQGERHGKTCSLTLFRHSRADTY